MKKTINIAAVRVHIWCQEYFEYALVLKVEPIIFCEMTSEVLRAKSWSSSNFSYLQQTLLNGFPNW